MALHTRWSSGDLIFYDGTQDIFTIKNSTGGLLIGESGVGVDVTFYGDSTGSTILWDQSDDALEFVGTDITLGDGDYVKFGAAPDVTMRWTTGNVFEILPDAAKSDVYIGSATLPLDVKFFGTTGGTEYMQWESTGPALVFDQADISMGDTDYIKFGDGNDFTMSVSTGNVLQIIPGTDHNDMNFGSTAGDKSIDIAIYGTTGSKHIKWVSTGDELDVTATIEMQSTERLQFGTSGSYIHASTGSQLDIVTTGTLYLNGEITYPDPTTETSTGDVTLTATSNRIQFLTTTTTGGINVIVPTAAAGNAGIEFKILNNSTASTGNVMTVRETESTGTTIVTLLKDEGGIVISDGSNWKGFVGGIT